MTTDIDAIIAEASTEANVQPAASTEAETPQTPQPEKEVKEEDVSQKPDSELTSEQLAKRERNRESKLNSKLAEMRRANRDLQARLAQTQTPPAPVKSDTWDFSKEPDLNDPYYKDKTWAQYTRDLVKFQSENTLAENNKKTEATQQQQAYKTWVDTQANKVDARLPELSAQIPDIEDVLADADMDSIVHSLTPEQARVALEAEDINLAVYTLQKEGKLEEVAKLPPNQLAAAIAKAEMRGQQYLNQTKQTITNAPTPIKAAKGNSTGGKSLEKQSVDELMNSYGFR